MILFFSFVKIERPNKAVVKKSEQKEKFFSVIENDVYKRCVSLKL